MKTTVISVLGTQKDAHGGNGPQRWDTWRPNIGLVQQDDLPIDELHLIFNAEHQALADRVKCDITSVSPGTNVIFDIVLAFESKRTPEEVKKQLTEELQAYDPHYLTVIAVDRAYA